MTEINIYEPADIEIHLKDRGMVLKEKSLIAVTPADGKILAIGKAAEEIPEKNREGVLVFSPLRQGMIADFTAASAMFKYMIKKVWGKKRFRRPRIVVCAPKGRTEVETKALEEVMYFAPAGAKEVIIYEGSLEQFMGEMQRNHAKQYAAYDVLIVITKNEPEKYISEELSHILDYAVQQGIPVTRVEELLKMK